MIMRRNRAGCTCNMLPLGFCFMHPMKLKKRSTSRKHNKMSKPTPEQLDKLIESIKLNQISYWCKWCNRNLPIEDGVFVHDDVFHPTDIVFDCVNEHKLH
jgi:hypothetical protein